MRIATLVVVMALCASHAGAEEITRDDKIISVLSLQRPCKLWLNEARLKELRTGMVERQRGSSMDAKMFAAMHDEAIAATFTIIGDHLARFFNDPEKDKATCSKAESYAKDLKLL